MKGEFLKLVFIVLVFSILTIVQHEFTHMEIYRSYGIDSKIGIDGIYAVTSTTNKTQVQEALYMSLPEFQQYQNWAEIIGYNFIILVLNLWGIALFLTVVRRISDREIYRKLKEIEDKIEEY